MKRLGITVSEERKWWDDWGDCYEVEVHVGPTGWKSCSVKWHLVTFWLLGLPLFTFTQ